MIAKFNMYIEKNFVSLFSGALGLDIGLEKAGFKLKAIVDCNNIAIQTAKLNLKRLDSDAYVAEVKMEMGNIDSICRNIIYRTKLKKGQLYLLAGAPPCQPFSTAGKRQSVMDARGDGFAIFLRAVRIFRPKYFVIENVKGVLSAAKKHRPLAERGSEFPPLKTEEEQGSAFMEILDNMDELCREIGYCVSWGVLNAADFGSPQSRERLIIIGSLEGKFVWPVPTYSIDGKNRTKKWLTLRDALFDLSDGTPLYKELNEEVSSYLKLIPAGGNWRNLPEYMHKDAIGGAFFSWGGRSGFLRRISWDKPSPTVTQNPAAKATMLCHPEGNRPLSVRECARIQQFPDEWVFAGNITDQYRQIGNATPIALAEAVGISINKAEKIKGAYKKSLYCAVPDLLNRMVRRPRTMLNPPILRKEKDLEKAKYWLKNAGQGREGFSKYQTFKPIANGQAL